MEAHEAEKLKQMDRAHAWHPFTPMRQWREKDPVIIEYAQGPYLIDTEGNRYLDGVSSLWCNVHGHRVAAIDQAVRDQLDRVAHTTMLGLANVPATRLAGRLAAIAPGGLNKVFYSDAGATATELAFKMAVGHWYHRGEPGRHKLLAIAGAYHGDTVGSMSVGYAPTFHRPFERMVFEVDFAPAPDVFHQDGGAAPDPSSPRVWALEDPTRCNLVRDRALEALDRKLKELGRQCAAVVVEPMVQGAAGLIVQPPGYLRGAADLAKKHGVLLIADEVATGFGRTGRMFACEHEGVEPDLMCLGKGLSGGYMPLAATLATDAVAAAFEGEPDEHRTLYHGHTFTGNPLACAAALASLDLFEQNNLLASVIDKAAIAAERLAPLRDADRCPKVVDVRQCGLMVGIELSAGADTGTGFDPTRRLGVAVTDACRAEGVMLRPLGNVVVLMPPLSIDVGPLEKMIQVVLDQIEKL